MTLAMQGTGLGRPAVAFEVAAVRRDFPILTVQARDRPLVYLDSAASAQKPRQVIDAVADFYRTSNANVHRAVHALGEQATLQFEGARDRARAFLNARAARELVFVRGATEGINLVAHSFLRPRLAAGDEVLLTQLEHHSNIVPWQLVCEQAGARLRVVPMRPDGSLELERVEELLTERTRLWALSHMSNALGTLNPVAQLIRTAHARGVPVLLDSAQAAPHLPLDVQALDCDFLVLSGHKLYGPTGIGILYGKAAHLEAMGPYQGGGEMIRSVSFAGTTYNDIPWRFEAGTPHIAGAVGLAAAMNYLQGLDRAGLERHERALRDAATAGLAALPGVRLIGTAPEKGAIVSFIVEGVHAHDVGTILDARGIAVRAGHHCAQPAMEYFGVPATVRASFGIYNTLEEVAALVAGVAAVREVFG